MTNLAIKSILAVMFTLATSIGASSQHIALKTNLAHWGTASPNLSAEFVFNENISLDFGVTANPFDFDRFKTRFYLIQPEVRYWFGRPMAQHFVGINGSMAQYDLRHHSTNYYGDAFMCGISYGYVFVLSRHWNLEANIGIGWIHTRYKKWTSPDGIPEVPNHKKDLIAPTRIGITLSYIIK